MPDKWVSQTRFWENNPTFNRQLDKIRDRLSFRRFVGLSASEKAPDHSVFSRFRHQLIQHSVHHRLFDELNRQLENRGLFVKKGTLVDATVMKASPKKPSQNEDGTAGKSAVDPEADWTKKSGRYLFGYKAHLGVDQVFKLWPGTQEEQEALDFLLAKL